MSEHWAQTKAQLKKTQTNPGFVSLHSIELGNGVGLFSVMLNEDKFSRPRPRTNRRGQGRGRGQTFEAEDEAKTMRPRPRPIFQDQRSPLILLCLRHKQSSISMSHPYCHLSLSSSIIKNSSSHNVEHAYRLESYHESELKHVMELVIYCESKLPIPALHTFSWGKNKKFKDRPRTNARGRGRGRGQNFGLEDSLASRT